MIIQPMQSQRHYVTSSFNALIQQIIWGDQFCH